MKIHKETAHISAEPAEVVEIAEGKYGFSSQGLMLRLTDAGKICKKCGEHYLKRHATCLAVLSRTPPKKKTQEEEEDYDQMMSEFYYNCQFKMKKPVEPKM